MLLAESLGLPAAVNFIRQNALRPTAIAVTVCLGLSVGATMTAGAFLTRKTVAITVPGVLAFAGGTAGGVLLERLFNLFAKNKIDLLIGSAGVSAVLMAARVSQVVGQKENPGNFLLIHTMGPNVTDVIGSVIAVGYSWCCLPDCAGHGELMRTLLEKNQP